MNKQIIFITDLFRVNGDSKYHLDPWLYSVFSLFSEQVFMSTGQYPALNLSRDEKLFSVEKFYKLCGYEYTEENWLKISAGKISSDAENYFINAFKDYFLIIYHANPVMIKLFQKHNVPYIDIFEGSVRFLEDLHLVMRTNIPAVYEKLLKYQYPEVSIYLEAGRVKSRYKNAGLNNYNIRPNSLLLCGQTETDISLLVGDKYITLSDCREKYEKIIKNYDYVYYKPHPHILDDSKNLEFIEQYTDFEVCCLNFYDFLSSPQITGVAALSSGTLKEAGYFRKNVHILSHLYADYHTEEKETDINKFVIMANDYYSPTFWSDILSPCLKTNKDVPYFNFNDNANFLRRNVFTWWGHEVGKGREEYLEININEIEALLPKAGYVLSKSIAFDMVVKWLLEHDERKRKEESLIIHINYVLAELELPLLMTREKNIF